MKKTLSLVMSTALTLGLLMGCAGGANADTAGQAAEEGSASQAAEETAAEASEAAQGDTEGSAGSADTQNPAEDSESTAEGDTVKADGQLDEESALKFLEDNLGKEDEETGNTYSFGYIADAEVDSQKYLVFDWSWLVDNDHMSRLDTIFIAADGSGIYSGVYDESGDSTVYKDVNLLTDKGNAGSTGEEENLDESSASLPVFTFGDDEPYMNAILAYMNENMASHYDAADVMIPLFQVLRTDDANKDEVRIWGDFWVMNYSLKDKNLAFESGGSYPGMFILKKDGEAYKVDSFDQVEDGSDYGPSSERIFGVDKELMDAFNKRDSDHDELRKKTIKEYAESNDLDIESYQDPGWDKVRI